MDVRVTWLDRIHVGDCRALMRAMIADGVRVNCIVTSPPYWGLRDYGMPGAYGLERTPMRYVARMRSTLRLARELLADDGVMWLNLGDCYATGAGKVGDCPCGGEQGARWRGDVDRIQDDKRGYRGDRLDNGRGDQAAANRKKTRATRDGTHAGKHTAMAAKGPMTQPNRLPIHGLKPKDLVGIPWRVAFALQADGWWLRSDVVWSKPNPMPESIKDRPTKSHEYVFLLTKSERYHYDAASIAEPAVSADEAKWDPGTDGLCGADRKTGQTTRRFGKSGNKARTYGDDRGRPNSNLGANVPWEGLTRNVRTVWSIGTDAFTGAHFATFPRDLVRRCVLAGAPADGVVFDPFMGSGTVAEVALSLGRRFIGCELNPEYAALFGTHRGQQQGMAI